MRAEMVPGNQLKIRQWLYLVAYDTMLSMQ